MEKSTKIRLITYISIPLVLGGAFSAKTQEDRTRYLNIKKYDLNFELTKMASVNYVSRNDPKQMFKFIKPDNKMNEFVQESLSGLKEPDRLDKLMAIYNSFALYGVNPGLSIVEQLEVKSPNKDFVGDWKYASSIFEDRNKERSCKNMTMLYCSALETIDIDSIMDDDGNDHD